MRKLLAVLFVAVAVLSVPVEAGARQRYQTAGVCCYPKGFTLKFPKSWSYRYENGCECVAFRDDNGRRRVLVGDPDDFITIVR